MLDWLNVGEFLSAYVGVKGPSGWGSSSTAEQIAQANKPPAGRVALVTGASSGLGFETARALAAAGMKVVVTARTMATAEATVAKLTALVPGGEFVPLEVELGSLASIRKFVDSFRATGLALHVLVANAGVAYIPREVTKDGFEAQFGVNHIGHFLLVTLLLPELKRSAPSRVVVVSSLGHYALGYADGIQWDDLAGEKHYSPSLRYGHSKLANLLFVKEFDAKYRSSGITAVALHPGMILTEISRHQLLPGLSRFGLDGALRIFGFKSIPQGAATSVYCSLASGIEPGEYYSDANVDKRVHPSALRSEDARRLWTITEELIASKTPKS